MGAGYDFLAERPRQESARDEVRLAEQHRLMARLAILELQNEVDGWIQRNFDALSVEAARELHEIVGRREKP